MGVCVRNARIQTEMLGVDLSYAIFGAEVVYIRPPPAPMFLYCRLTTSFWLGMSKSQPTQLSQHMNSGVGEIRQS